VNFWDDQDPSLRLMGPMLWLFKYFRRKIQQKIGVFDSKQS
jgi:hypothetical protein